MVELQGKVARGTGRSSGWYAEDDVLSEALRAELAGRELCKGTLNVLVAVDAHPELRAQLTADRPFFVPTELGPPYIRHVQRGHVPYRLCTLRKRTENSLPARAYLVRTRWPGTFSQPGTGQQSDRGFAQFEVVAERLNIAYGDDVELAFDEAEGIRVAAVR